VDFAPLWSWPKPKAPIPVLVGGNARQTFRRVMEYGDGWMPMNRGNPEDLQRRIAELRVITATAGRPQVPVTIFGATLSGAAIDHYQDLVSCASNSIDKS
jgi:alkanesulfonate monooxygenase SsuD/methylene tetrahydromethanopterin reductase-like flavin-dependent oxidoreductase (luciferase family)